MIKENDRGFVDELIIPWNTLIAASTRNESIKPVNPIDDAASAITIASAHFLLTVSVNFPTNNPKIAKGKVYANPVKFP